MSTEDEAVFVTTPALVEVTGIRDRSMQALVILAVTFGWNVLQKPNQPVVITSRGGFQKRLPTDTSIRMSVFQTALASILLYSEPYKPTPELMEAIIDCTKVDVEHARRLRLIVGESDAVLAERVKNTQAEERETTVTDYTHSVPPQPFPEASIAKLLPAEAVDRRPTNQDMDDWAAYVATFLGAKSQYRRGLVFYLDFGVEYPINTHTGKPGQWMWCAFPGCRYHQAPDKNPWLIHGHNRAHTGTWGPLSDSESSRSRHRQAAAKRERQADEYRARVEAEKDEELQASIKVAKAADKVVAKMKASDDLVDRFTEHALALLEIANSMVIDIDEVTNRLSRNGVDSAELEELRAKAAKYDLLVQALK